MTEQNKTKTTDTKDRVTLEWHGMELKIPRSAVDKLNKSCKEDLEKTPAYSYYPAKARHIWAKKLDDSIPVGALHVVLAAAIGFTAGNALKHETPDTTAGDNETQVTEQLQTELNAVAEQYQAFATVDLQNGAFAQAQEQRRTAYKAFQRQAGIFTENVLLAQDLSEKSAQELLQELEDKTVSLDDLGKRFDTESIGHLRECRTAAINDIKNETPTMIRRKTERCLSEETRSINLHSMGGAIGGVALTVLFGMAIGPARIRRWAVVKPNRYQW